MISVIRNWVVNRSTDHIFGFTAIALFALAIYQANNHFHLYADGSHFLINILSQQNVFNPLHSRLSANVIQQLFPLALIKTGVLDLRLISFSYGMNLYLIPIMGLLVSYTILDGKRKELIILPILTTLFSLHNNYAFIISESFVSISLFWPLLFFVLFKELKTPVFWIFLVSVLILSNTHELAFLLLILIGFSILIRKKTVREPISKTLLLISSVLVGIIFNLYWSFYPPNPEFSEDFVSQLQGLSSLKQYPLSGLILLILFLPLFYQPKGKWRILTAVILILLICVILIPLFSSSGMLYPILHWEQRILIIIGPLLVGVLFLLAIWKSSLETILFQRWAILLVTGAMLFYQFKLTNLWGGFIDDFRSTLNKKTGIIEYQESILATNPTDEQFVTAWTLPTLGFLLHSFADSEITSLMSMPYEVWQPWHAMDTYGRPDLSAFGVRYRLFGPNPFID